jgi:hypothetical protein
MKGNSLAFSNLARQDPVEFRFRLCAVAITELFYDAQDSEA